MMRRFHFIAVFFSVLFFVAHWQPEAGFTPQVFWAPMGCSLLFWMSRGLWARVVLFAVVLYLPFFPVPLLSNFDVGVWGDSNHRSTFCCIINGVLRDAVDVCWTVVIVAKLGVFPGVDPKTGKGGRYGTSAKRTSRGSPPDLIWSNLSSAPGARFLFCPSICTCISFHCLWDYAFPLVGNDLLVGRCTINFFSHLFVLCNHSFPLSYNHYIL